MGFKAREIWAVTLGTITLFRQLVANGNDGLYLIDILLAVITVTFAVYRYRILPIH